MKSKSKIIAIIAIAVFLMSLITFSAYTYKNVQMAALDPANKADAILSDMAKSVNQQALYALSVSHNFLKKDSRDYYDFYATIAAMNAVQQRVNTMSYGYINGIEKQNISSSDWAIIKQAGICGNHSEAFMRLLNKLHIKSRPVQFFNIDKYGSNHVAAEVFFNNKWNYFDISWGTYFPVNKNAINSVELLSIDELRKSKNPLQYANTNNANLSYLIMRAEEGAPSLSYLTSPSINIVVDGTGTVDVYPKEVEKGIVDYTPRSIPIFFGSYQLNFGEGLPQPKVNMTYNLPTIPQAQTFEMDINYNTCLPGSKVIMVLKDSKNPKNTSMMKMDALELKPGKNIFSTEKLGLKPGSNLELSTSTDENNLCYIGVQNMRFMA